MNSSEAVAADSTHWLRGKVARPVATMQQHEAAHARHQLSQCAPGKRGLSVYSSAMIAPIANRSMALV